MFSLSYIELLEGHFARCFWKKIKKAGTGWTTCRRTTALHSLILFRPISHIATVSL